MLKKQFNKVRLIILGSHVGDRWTMFEMKSSIGKRFSKIPCMLIFFIKTLNKISSNGDEISTIILKTRSENVCK